MAHIECHVGLDALTVRSFDLGPPNSVLAVLDQRTHSVALLMQLEDAARDGNAAVTRYSETADAGSVLAGMMPVLADSSPIGPCPERGFVPRACVVLQNFVGFCQRLGVFHLIEPAACALLVRRKTGGGLKALTPFVRDDRIPACGVAVVVPSFLDDEAQTVAAAYVERDFRLDSLTVRSVDLGSPHPLQAVTDFNAHAVALLVQLENTSADGYAAFPRYPKATNAGHALAGMVPVLADSSPIGARPIG